MDFLLQMNNPVLYSSTIVAFPSSFSPLEFYIHKYKYGVYYILLLIIIFIIIIIIIIIIICKLHA